MKSIELYSRYNDTKPVGIFIEENKVLTTSNSHYIRMIYDNNEGEDTKSLHAIDFEGGPFLQVGHEFADTGKRIKKVTQKTCFILELEDDLSGK